MSNGQQIPNPLAAPLTALKQIGEQANMTIQSLGTGMAKSASLGLDALISGAPPIPGLPGVPGQAAKFPTPQSLLPANLQQALGQIENVLIPPGLPRPSQVITGAPTPTPAAPPAAAPTGPTPTAISGRRRITELGGY